VNAQGPTPPGWYPDPGGGLRRHDGSAWTEETRPPHAPASPAPGGPHRGAMIGIVVAAVVLVAAAATALVLVLGGDDDGDEGAGGDPVAQTSDESTDEPTEEPTDEPGEPTRDRPAAEPEDPADVVHSFVDAALRGDCAAAESFVTDRLLRREGGCDPANLGSELDGVGFQVGEAEIHGDTATVPLTLFISGSTPTDQDEQPLPDSEFTLDLGLVVRDDAWRIDDFGQPGDMQ